jgi:hypothetical protein
MTLAMASSSGWVASVGAPDVPYPSGVAAGNLLVLYVTGRYSTAVTPVADGFTLQTNPGAAANGGVPGTNGVATGTSKTWILTKVATGTETGNLSVETTGNNFQAKIERFTKTGAAWDIAAAVGGDVTLAPSLNVTGNQAIDLAAGDWLLSAAVVADSTNTISNATFAATGITFGTGTSDSSSSTLGSAQSAQTHRRAVTAGTASVAPSLSCTLDTADAGSAAFLRIREAGSPAVVSHVATFKGHSGTTDPETFEVALSGLSSGDFLLATATWNNLLTSPVSITSGWTVIGGGANNTVDDTASSTLFAYKYASGSETEFQVDWTTPTTLRTAVTVEQYTGVDGASLTTYPPQTGIESGSSDTHNCPTITTSTAAYIINVLAVRQTGLTGWTPPSPYTERSLNVQGASGTNAIGVYDTNGTVGAGTVGGGNYTTLPAATLVPSGAMLTVALFAGTADPQIPVTVVVPATATAAPQSQTPLASGQDRLSAATPAITITPVAPTISAVLSVAKELTVRYDVAFNSQTIVGRSLTLRYNLRVAAGKSLQTIYDVLTSQLVAGKSLSVSWNQRQLVSATLQTLYNVEAETPVTQYNLEIDGLNMRTEAWNVSTLTGRYSMPTLRGEDLTVPGRSGYYFVPGKASEAGVGALAVWVAGKNPDGTIPGTQTGRVAKFKENLALIQRVFQRRHRLSTMRAGQTDGTFRVAQVQWVEWSEPEVQAGGTWAQWSIGYSIPSVYWSDEDARSQVTSASSTLPKDLNLTQFADMTGVIDDALISVTGPITNPRVTDAETGHYIELIGTVASGEVWIVDVGASTSTRNGVSVLQNTRHAGSYRFLTISNLYGLSGTPRLVLSGSGGGGTTRFGIVARRKWVSA